MQQRVALARSFVTSPSVLLMDEPFGALDEITRSAMRFELMRVWRSEAASSAAAPSSSSRTASPEAVLLSDRVIVMSPQPGRIAASLEIDLPRPRDEEIEETPAVHRLHPPAARPAAGARAGMSTGDAAGLA